MSDLAQILHSLLATHNLRAIEIHAQECCDYVQAFVFWNDAEADHGCRLVKAEHPTDAALALSMAIKKANADRCAVSDVPMLTIGSVAA
jgi:hypothetical protein